MTIPTKHEAEMTWRRGKANERSSLKAAWDEHIRRNAVGPLKHNAARRLTMAEARWAYAHRARLDAMAKRSRDIKATMGARCRGA